MLISQFWYMHIVCKKLTLGEAIQVLYSIFTYTLDFKSKTILKQKAFFFFKEKLLW